MLALARVGPRDVVYDLGSGDGRIPITAARRYGARGVGIDINPLRIEESRAAARRAGVQDRVTVRQQDLFRADLREATVVTLYLTDALNLRLGLRGLAYAGEQLVLGGTLRGTADFGVGVGEADADGMSGFVLKLQRP